MTINWYLFSAYVVVWTLLFIYLVFLHSKQKQVAQELQQIAETIDRGK